MSAPRMRPARACRPATASKVIARVNTVIRQCSTLPPAARAPRPVAVAKRQEAIDAR